MQLAAVKKDPQAIQYIKNPSKEVQLLVVKKNWKLLQYIKNPDKEVQLVAVKQDPQAIQYIKNPSKEVQLVVVKENWKLLRYIKNPDKEVQLTAVKQNWHAIQYIKNPDKEVQLIAVKQNRQAIQYIKYPSKEVQLIAGKPVDMSLSDISFFASNKDISIKVYDGKLKIFNNTKNFLKILSIAEYNGEKIYSLSPLSIPPEGVKTLTPYSSVITFHSLDEEVLFGYAIEYKVGNSITKDLYETQKYSFKNFQ
jgi:hypothetical protein